MAKRTVTVPRRFTRGKSPAEIAREIGKAFKGRQNVTLRKIRVVDPIKNTVEITFDQIPKAPSKKRLTNMEKRFIKNARKFMKSATEPGTL